MCATARRQTEAWECSKGIFHEPPKIFSTHWNCRGGAGDLVGSNGLPACNVIKSCRSCEVPRKDRDDPAHRPAATVGNSDPLFSAGPHAKRSVLRSVAPGRDPDVRGPSNISAQCQRPGPAAFAAK